MLTIGSLFSGIGGLELGLEWSGLGPVVWQVEKDEFCRRKLAWRYPDAARFEDVRSVGAANLAAVDLICGGFPCQDVSSAGKRAGLDGARSGLWYEFARVVGEMRPRWVVVENVRSGANKWVKHVRRGMERLGYATLPIPISASDCGAPHERARVFVLGCLDPYADNKILASSEHGWWGARQPARTASDAVRERCDAWSELVEARTLAIPARGFARHSGWASEPALARVVHGLPGRMDYERALGNSVVPQCAEVVGHVIRRLLSPALNPAHHPTTDASDP